MGSSDGFLYKDSLLAFRLSGMSKIAFLLFSGRKFGGMERRYVRLFLHFYRNDGDVVLLSTHDAIEGARDLGMIIPEGAVRFIDFDLGSFPVFIRKANRLYGLIRALLISAVERYRHVHIVANPGFLVSLYSRMRFFLPRYSFSVVDSRLGFRPELIVQTVRFAYAIDCLSETIGQFVKARCRRIADTQKIHVAPCSFIDLKEINVEPQVRDIDVVMMARFSPEKGYSLLMEALPKIPMDLVVHLCGFGPVPPKSARAKVYECREPIKVLSRSKIFLSIQQTENYPSQALLEAMACGCAIIATDVGETRRLLDESCAVLIPSSPVSLADAIRGLASDADRCRDLGAAARKRVFEDHTLERFAAYFEDAILGGGVAGKSRSSFRENRRH